MSEYVKTKLLVNNAQYLVVVGYSGMDNSVMNALEEYVETNKDKAIIWCAKGDYISDNVKSFMKKANKLNLNQYLSSSRLLGGFFVLLKS